MPRVTRAEQQERTHQRLLEVGSAVFMRRGFLAATVEDVAAEAGYTRGAVYKHFGGKEGLWNAIVASRADTELSMLREILGRVRSRDELITALSPGDSSYQVRWILASTEFLASVAGKREVAAEIVDAQRKREQEIVAVLTALCERIGVRPAMPLSQVVVALTALTGNLVLRQAADPSIDVSAMVNGVLLAIFPEGRGCG
jgi:AcrR family transcriptional regulator